MRQKKNIKKAAIHSKKPPKRPFKLSNNSEALYSHTL